MTLIGSDWKALWECEEGIEMDVCPLCGKKFGASGDGPYGTTAEAMKHMTMQHPGVAAPTNPRNDTKQVKYS